MNEFQEPKSEYEHIPIPAELSERVQEGLRQGRRARTRRRWTRSIGTVAACFAVLVGTLNLSPTVAAAAADVPVLGGLFQVLTVRNYTTEQDQAHYQVNAKGGGPGPAGAGPGPSAPWPPALPSWWER